MRPTRALLLAPGGINASQFRRFSSVHSFRICRQKSGQLLPDRTLAFEPNRGQASAEVRFVARGNSRDYFLSKSGVTVLGASLRFRARANDSEPRIVPVNPAKRRHNYFHGAVAVSRTDIPTYGRVRYSGLYPWHRLRILWRSEGPGIRF